MPFVKHYHNFVVIVEIFESLITFEGDDLKQEF